MQPCKGTGMYVKAHVPEYKPDRGLTRVKIVAKYSDQTGENLDQNKVGLKNFCPGGFSLKVLEGDGQKELRLHLEKLHGSVAR